MKLALGTVQFGLSYGITNDLGQVKQNDVASILEYATNSNIHMLDTATAYGNSENILGELSTQEFDVVSKIPSVKKLNKPIIQSIIESLQNLKRTHLYGIMFHDENDLICSPQHFKVLKTAKQDGLVKRVGCSFYSVEALKKTLDMNYDIDIIQIPANGLDQRFFQSGLLYEAKKRGIEIHCRSLFLQGLLLDRNTTLPKSMMPFKEELEHFFKFCESYDITPLMAALMAIKQMSVIDYGIVGCISKNQLKEIVTSYDKINKLDLFIDFDLISSSNILLLNPTHWN